MASNDRSARSRRRFARVWSWIDDGVDEVVAPAKDAAFVELPDRLVEIGPGRGSNFHRYRPGTVVVAFEPNEFMHRDLRAAAAAHGIELDLRTRGVEAMDLPDASEELVISTLTLCSVDDRDAALKEIRRVLKPGGRFRFVEHIAAEPGSWTARFQRLLRRPWAAIADRCDLQADTREAVDRAGFSEVEIEIRELGSIVDPSRRTFYGVAVR